MDEKIIDVEVEEIEETTEEPKGFFVNAGIAVQNFADNAKEAIRDNWKKVLIGVGIGAGAIVLTGGAALFLNGSDEDEDDNYVDGELEVEVTTEIPFDVESNSTEDTEDSDDK